VAVGTTPEPLRQQFGYAWDERRERRLAEVQAITARAFSIAPRPTRTTPGWVYGRILLWQAARRVGGTVATAQV
jgi:uncharacterized protein (DUF2236 family)